MGTERSASLFENSVVIAEDLYSVESVGAGADVIFIPGHGSSKLVWHAVTQELCTNHRAHSVQVAGMAGAVPPRAGAVGLALAQRLFEAACADVPEIQRTCIADSLHLVMEDQPEAFAASVHHFLR